MVVRGNGRWRVRFGGGSTGGKEKFRRNEGKFLKCFRFFRALVAPEVVVQMQKESKLQSMTMVHAKRIPVAWNGIHNLHG